MLKNIQFKLINIKYNGDSIGDDVRIEIVALGNFLRVDKRIKIRTTTQINQTVAIFETDQKIFKFNAQVTVIEKDLLFNDTGNKVVDIEVDTLNTKSQNFSCKIEIKETRSILGKIWGDKTAIFEIILEADVFDAVRYMPNNDELKGWIKVKFEDDKSVKSMPAYLKVKFIKYDNKREYFTILEGAYRGKIASVTLRDDGSSWLIFDAEHGSSARILYSISQKLLTLNGKKYKTADYLGSPWQKGLYDIEIPDYPQPSGSRYEEKAPRAKTWFRIGHSGARYLHTGARSLGCITITETTRWSEIYNALIKARKGDFISVGALEIID